MCHSRNELCFFFAAHIAPLQPASKLWACLCILIVSVLNVHLDSIINRRGVLVTCMKECCAAWSWQCGSGAPCVLRDDRNVAAGAYKVSGSLRGASTALLRLLVNGAQVQQAPMLAIVPGTAASVAWINHSTLAGGLTVSAGEEGFAELACLDAYGNRLTSVAVGISAELKHESGQVRCACLPHLPFVENS
jgi:hypothetical protein